MPAPETSDHCPVLFIVGCGRSGTTVLGEALDRHPDVTNWYEPYFIWDYLLGIPDTNVRTADMATPDVVRFIRREFETYRRKAGARIVVDKSPEHCFTIPFVTKVFPQARWVHLIRDGRDVTLSMNREWTKRAEIVARRDWRRFVAVAHEMLSLQPYWRNRLQAVLFELKTNRSLNPLEYLNKSKWGGRVGYGPRFPGWREHLDRLDPLQFNAMQWRTSVESVLAARVGFPPGHYMEVRYEDLLANPGDVLRRVVAFAGLDDGGRGALGDALWRSNSGAWKSLPPSQLRLIEPIIGDLLIQLGYATTGDWVDATAPGPRPGDTP